jgi:hypothetical protein
VGVATDHVDACAFDAINLACEAVGDRFDARREAFEDEDVRDSVVLYELGVDRCDACCWVVAKEGNTVECAG